MPINKFKSNGGQHEYKLYGGEVLLTFKDYGHKYEIDGVERVGVTTVLNTIIAKEALVNWAVKMTAEHLLSAYDHTKIYSKEEFSFLVTNAKKAHITKKESAGNIGTKVHKKIETYIKAKIANVPTNMEDVDEDIKEPIKAFLEWEKKNKVVWEMSERPIYSRKYDYCGTLDFVAKVNGMRVVGDIKTSNYIYPESYYLQLAAYRYALQEEKPNLHIDGMLIIKVPKTIESKLEVVSVPNFKDNAKAFIYGLYLYNQITKLKNLYKTAR